MSSIHTDRVAGCMVGLAIGDALEPRLNSFLGANSAKNFRRGFAT